MKEFNSFAKGDGIFSYKEGNSYGSGKADPWGTAYYVTAKKDYNEDLSTFSFYVTSAGPNKQFNASTMVLDKDEHHASALATAAICHSLLDDPVMSKYYTDLAVEHGYSRKKIEDTVSTLKKRVK